MRTPYQRKSETSGEHTHDALSSLWALDVEDGLAAADANDDGLCRFVRRGSFPMDYSAGHKGEVSGSAVELLAPIGTELHHD